MRSIYGLKQPPFLQMSTQNGDLRHRQLNGKVSNLANGATIAGKNDIAHTKDEDAKTSANTVNLLICVGGIYASL